MIKLDQIEPRLSYETIAPIGTAGMLIFWSFFGWEAIASLAPEFKNPKKDIVKATWGAIIIVGVIYLGSALAVIGTHSFSESVSIDELMNNASLVQVMIKTTGVNGGYATAMVALVICLGTTNAFVASISRLGYSLAHDKLAPSWFDNINEEYSTPTRAIIFVGFFASVGLIITYAYNIEMNKLVYIPNPLGIATYILGSLAGAKLLKSKAEKLMATLTCIACFIAYPFVGVFVQIPIVVGVSCILYVYWRTKKERKVMDNIQTS